MLHVDPVIQEELTPFLERNEKLIWTGRPRQGILFFLRDIFIIPFSLVWGGTVVWGETLAVYHLNIGLVIALIPLLIVSWFLIVGRFYWDARRRANTTYGLTQENVIVWSGIFGKSVQTFKIQNLAGLTLIMERKGTGSISLGPTYSKSTRWVEKIENPQEVFDKINELNTKG